jgi:hypothetical protein
MEPSAWCSRTAYLTVQERRWLRSLPAGRRLAIDDLAARVEDRPPQWSSPSAAITAVSAGAGVSACCRRIHESVARIAPRRRSWRPVEAWRCCRHARRTASSRTRGALVREIGIRVAPARGRDVVRLIRRSAAPRAPVALARGCGRDRARLGPSCPYGVDSTDPVTAAAVPALLLAVHSLRSRPRAARSPGSQCRVEAGVGGSDMGVSAFEV